ncbi:PorP/SprF family type IX secretion system membrane protein [Flavobacterium sp. LB1P71]|uniref:PorP/SprF family type IX secretion system membrane protein n=1 Tax=unclassified Flavobacterium TaxID=196869 RepID=UPI003AB0DC55
MRKALLFIVFFYGTLQILYSQEHEDGVVSFSLPIRNSLKFNKFLINPTFSFVREQTTNISFYNKRQWVQFDDAPQTYLASYSGRFRENEGIAIGLFQQNYGVLTTFGAVANFAHNVILQEDSNLTFGMNVGFYKSGLNKSKVITNYSDPSLENIPSNSLIMVNPGINYGTAFLDFGLSVNNLILYNLKTSKIIEDDPEKSIEAHIMHTGYLDTYGFFDKSKFSALLKTEFKKDKTILSGLMMFAIPKGVWAQAGYNTVYGMSGGIGMNITPKISIEYNFEKATGNLSNFGSSHEIVFAYKFKSNSYYYGDDEEEGSIITPVEARKSRSVAPKESAILSPIDAQRLKELKLAMIAEKEEIRLFKLKEIAEARAKLAADNKAKLDAAASAKHVDAAAIKAKLIADAAAKAKLTTNLQVIAKPLTEAKAKLDPTSKPKADALAQAKLAADAKAKLAAAKAKALTQAKLASDAKVKADADVQAKLVADAKVKADVIAQAKSAADVKAKADADMQAKLVAAAKAKADVLAQEKLAADTKAKADALAQTKLAAAKAKADALTQAKLVAAAKAKADVLAQEKLAADTKAKADADVQAKLVADAKVKADALAQAKLAADAKAKADALAQEKLVADAKAKADALDQTKLVSDGKAKADALAQAKLAADVKAKADADMQAKLAADAKAKADALAQEKLAADAKAKEAADIQAKLAATAKDSDIKSMDNLAKLVEDSKNTQQQLLTRLDATVASKEKDLKDLKEENDLSDKGILSEPKPFKSVSAENSALEALKLEIAVVNKTQNEKIIALDNLYKERIQKVPNKNDATNQYYLKTIETLKAEQLKVIQANMNLISSLEKIKAETEIEKKRRIKRAGFENDQSRYLKDKATLSRIKEKTPFSAIPLKAEDFDYGDEQSNMQILKNIKNVESGYYLVVAVHNDVAKRDDFLTKSVAAGQSNIDFFYDINTSKYFIYYDKFDTIEQAKKALQAKGNKPYNSKMSIAKIEN